MKIETKNILEAECLETLEGLMKPLILSERLGVIHITIQAGLEVAPHAHTTGLHNSKKYRNGAT